MGRCRQIAAAHGVERKRLETQLADDAELRRRSEDIEAYFDLMREGEDSVEPDLKREIESLVTFSEALDSRTMLSEENDALNAIVTGSSRRRRHRIAGLGRDAYAHVPALG